jgi:hypothetical protein
MLPRAGTRESIFVCGLPRRHSPNQAVGFPPGAVLAGGAGSSEGVE